MIKPVTEEEMRGLLTTSALDPLVCRSLLAYAKAKAEAEQKDFQGRVESGGIKKGEWDSPAWEYEEKDWLAVVLARIGWPKDLKIDGK